MGVWGRLNAVERASARRGLGRQPHILWQDGETGNRASIRTCWGQGIVGFPVHDSIQVSVFKAPHGDGWNGGIHGSGNLARACRAASHCLLI